MSGSRLARGRASRMAILMVSVVLICCGYYVYRQTRAEMDKLRELHTKCNQQLDTLQAQLQVIYEYKVQLEKTLSNEKSANAAVKEELQLKASRERSMRDKDMVEAQQRYKSLQQQYKILQTGHKDLKDDCEKKAKVAYENTNICETKLVDLRKLLKKEKDEKDDLSKSLDHLKNKCMDEGQKKEQLEEQYENLVKTNQNDNGELARLQKQVIQLTRELDKYNKNNVGNLDIDNGQILPRYSNSDINDANPANNLVVEEKSNPAAMDKDQMQMNRPSSLSSQHQVSPSSEALQAGQNPQPLQAPQNNRHLVDLHDNNQNDDENNNNNTINNNNDENDMLQNIHSDDSLHEIKSDVRFASRGGNIVPVGPNEPNELNDQPEIVPLASPDENKPDSRIKFAYPSERDINGPPGNDQVKVPRVRPPVLIAMPSSTENLFKSEPSLPELKDFD
ncbi:hypothetical protein TKK_0015180 [Trichogramma kaykai]|uniref:Golgi integral membrane protein 4 n=1 Tax=Trichogramma kaykai TaxID=54128 RepID=A0ABD2WBS1_9HYME